VHTDLTANRLIENPIFGDNEYDLKWIEREDWEYRTFFRADSLLLGHERIEIFFEGLDTYATVFINGSAVLEAGNMFRSWRIRCNEMLKEGMNSLRVLFHSPVIRGEVESGRSKYTLPGGERVFTRKAAYHYGWDWGPRFVTSGIWKRVFLRAWSGARIEDLWIAQRDVTGKRAALSAVFEIEAARGLEVEASLEMVPEHRSFRSGRTRVESGMNKIAIDFTIEDPRLWWTNGLGDAYMYSLRGVLSIDGKVVDESDARIGVRTLELVQRRDGEGEGFEFELNGVPVFMKGANYIPQDNFVSGVSPARYVELIRSAKDANMNMLRVWGGGVYEDDIFYDLCDENGILVWQDFMFACAMYPGDLRFLEDVEQEAVDVVKRLRNHPCLALWCGNNEISEGWHNWGWQRLHGYSAGDSTEIYNSYEALFHGVLPSAVSEHDPGRPFWASSTRYGRGDPRSLGEGDSHYWGVWHDGEPFAMFEKRVGRFMSEFGFQSFPPIETVRLFVPYGDLSIDSESMLAHQKHPRGNHIISTYMEREFGIPEDFEKFIYISQLLQAGGLKTAVEAHRRAKPYCMGSLYWQLNDCWPGVSWSGIDYYGRWKALHYFMKRAFEKILVSPVLDGGVIGVHIVSDELRDIEARLELSLRDFEGSDLWRREIESTVEANASKTYFETSAEDLLDGRERESVVFVTELYQKGILICRNLLFFAPPKRLRLSKPQIEIAVSPAPGGCLVDLVSDRLARGVFLRYADGKGFFTDNYFDLLPGVRAEVLLLTGKGAGVDADSMIVTTLFDALTPTGM